MILLAEDEAPVAPLVVVTLVGLLVLLLGVAHYRGWQKSGLLRLPFDSIHFAPAWLGAAVVIAALGSLGTRLTDWFVIVDLFAVPPFVIALLALFWLPDRLLPEWYLAWRGRGRPTAEVASRSDRIAYAYRERRAQEKARRRSP